MVRGVCFPKQQVASSASLASSYGTIPQPWGPLPAPVPTTVAPKRAELRALSLATRCLPAWERSALPVTIKFIIKTGWCWDKGIGKSSTFRLGGSGEIVRFLHIDPILAEGRGQILHG